MSKIENMLHLNLVLLVMTLMTFSCEQNKSQEIEAGEIINKNIRQILANNCEGNIDYNLTKMRRVGGKVVKNVDKAEEYIYLIKNRFNFTVASKKKNT